jgi:hypothetical protein
VNLQNLKSFIRRITQKRWTQKENLCREPMPRAQYHPEVIIYLKKKKELSFLTVEVTLLEQAVSKNSKNKMYLIVTMRNARVWVFSLIELSSDT